MIGIFHGGISAKNGPGKVALNLTEGLKRLGVDYVENEEGDMTGCLASWSPRFKDLPKETLVGPNLLVLPTEDPSIFSYFDHFITPCDWVKNYFNLFNLPENVNLHVWAVGIDTELFSPHRGVKSKCLVYHKRGNENTLQEILKTLHLMKIEPIVLNYGNYEESDLIEACDSSLFAILNTSTESQGIAYQEILSKGVPCYVIDKSVWDDRPGYRFDATSTPYFDDRCGIKHDSMSRFGEFLDRLSSFKPREYITENLTLEKCASEYIRLLEISHNEHQEQ
jgi:glycosyltransferase involved in cell wall biosynthesis|tara:strand:- start:1114 stop:1953 length:840 start_codon:yes stop_codon:yes gene_type:complete